MRCLPPGRIPNGCPTKEGSLRDTGGFFRGCSAGSVLSILLFTSFACTDSEKPGSPTDVASQAEAAPLQLGFVRSTAGSYTIREEFASMAQRVPGGFGGFFFDEKGELTVVLNETGRQQEAWAALANEPFLQSRQDGPGGERFSLQRARTLQGTYQYDQLYEWYYAQRRNLPFSPRTGAITVSQNKLTFGAASEDQIRIIREIARRIGVPADAIQGKIVTSIPLLHGPALPRVDDLEDKLRPLPAGMKSTYCYHRPPPAPKNPSPLGRKQSSGSPVRQHVVR